MIKIDLNKAAVQAENFQDGEHWHAGYHTGLLTMTDIFAEAVFHQGATIEQVAQLITRIRLSTTPVDETDRGPEVTQMPDGTEI